MLGKILFDLLIGEIIFQLTIQKMSCSALGFSCNMELIFCKNLEFYAVHEDTTPV
jgi:hypothetical protein